MQYEPFETIYQRAVIRHGGIQQLEATLIKPLTKEKLLQHKDDRWLAAFSQKIFQSGISWQVVRNKWPAFEEVFFNFDIEKMLLLPDEVWEKKAQDPRIIRHFGKVLTIKENAFMIHNRQKNHSSFSQFIADWPVNDIVNLWAYLKKSGARLGGNTGPYTLRVMGKDTFLLTKDVERYLRQHGIITTGKNTLSALNCAQDAFNHWHKESGRSLTEISQCIAFSVN
ncbi:DNA-3-methyladenine glycosylase I [Marinomonas sp. C2222]|uniref:DNA-3-methyladenine glycosylase I n=1 Tax=Marinomonas sargassi TaxID=2984494 RepID=A0ABT2YRQ2_9GAMM|nr:DNA-3-methyladenine glycosylase I [Marinomonas sargassi]MCV2402329.1 DNA-3-methyladenine glycosylase I [Marinomonas sargassi]